MMRLYPKSIRWRIQIWHGALLVLLVALLTIGFYTYESRARIQAVDARLQEFLTPLLPALTPPGGPPRPGERPPRPGERPPRPGERPPGGGFGPRRPELSGSVQARLAEGYYYAGWSAEGRELGRSTNAPADLMPPEIDEEWSPMSWTRGSWRELAHVSRGSDVVVVGVSIAAIEAELGRLAGWLAGAGLLVASVGIAGGWWLANRAIRPIGAISVAAREIAGGDLSRRINTDETESELGTLATTLNQTFARLEKNFEQQARFTADASHELRTPIAVLLAETQRVLLRERTPEEYRQALAVCERGGERMRALVESLLELARLDSGEVALQPGPCELASLAQESITFLAPLAAQKRITLRDSLEAVTVKADPLKLGQVLNNLLTNAIVHNREGTEITLTVKREAKGALITVADNGVGIPPEAVPHLFARFYRVDKSRARTQGGSGLGLAISKAIVEAHGGSIAIESELGVCTKVTIRLPEG